MLRKGGGRLRVVSEGGGILPSCGNTQFNLFSRFFSFHTFPVLHFSLFNRKENSQNQNLYLRGRREGGARIFFMQ